MTTLADFRARVLYAMGVTASSERGLTDTNVDEHIRRAVEEFGLYVPAQATADLTLIGGARTLSTAGLTRAVAVTAVEYPIGAWPRRLIDFDVWGSTVTLDLQPPAADYTVRLYYTQRHVVDASGSTIDPAHESVIVEGAAAHAILARAMGAANTAETATVAPQTYQHLRVAQERLDRWRALLRRLSGRIDRRVLYVPGSGPLRRDVVTWPG
jgi:hypothetical protein